MLKLTRGKGERVIIGNDEVIVTVLDVDRKTGKARLGFEADEDVTIHREEVFLRIKREQEMNDE
jgi:carbon storage regulator